MTPSEVIRLAREAGIRFGEFDVLFEDRKVTRTMGAQPIENIARLISLAKAEALADGWQPIETAPEGVMVLCADMKATEARHWCFVAWMVSGRVHGLHQGITKPTHWRPLPPPPKEAP